MQISRKVVLGMKMSLTYHFFDHKNRVVLTILQNEKAPMDEFHRGFGFYQSKFKK